MKTIKPLTIISDTVPIINNIAWKYNYKINAYQVTINTKDKYYIIYDTASSANISYIEFLPIIYDDNNNCLHDTDIDAYMSHPSYFSHTIEIHTPFTSSVVYTTALKYEYLITVFNIADYF